MGVVWSQGGVGPLGMIRLTLEVPDEPSQKAKK